MTLKFRSSIWKDNMPWSSSSKPVIFTCFDECIHCHCCPLHPLLLMGTGGTLWEYLALYAFHLGKMAAAEHYATNHTEPLNGKWARKLI